MASIKYDKEARALYVRVAQGKKQIKEMISIGEDRFLDVDKDGRVIGFEILLPKSIPKEALAAIARSKDIIETIQ